MPHMRRRVLQMNSHNCAQIGMGLNKMDDSYTRVAISKPKSKCKPKSANISKRLREDRYFHVTDETTLAPELMPSGMSEVEAAIYRKHWSAIRTYTHGTKLNTVENIRFERVNEDVIRKHC